MAENSTRFKYFVAASPGLESLLFSELNELGVAGIEVSGGVECTGSPETLWHVHHQSRLAESVRVRLRPFKAQGFPALEQNLRRIPWHAYLRSQGKFTLSVTSQGSRLYHTGAIAERAERVIRASFEGRSPPESVPLATEADDSLVQKFQIRVHHDLVQVSVDASGERLHRRGYRTHVGQAPLRETLAAATLRLLEGRASTPLTNLWDPCCGSGTFLAEWLIPRLGWSGASVRRFAFENWPIHDGDAYANWVATRVRSVPSPLASRAYGSDKDPRCIDAARHNLAQANVLASCELFAEDFHTALERIPRNTAVVSNLPYGVRLVDTSSAARIFQALDAVLWSRKDLRPVVLLHTLTRLPSTRCRWQSLAAFANGGLHVKAWSTD